jgi:hypothetical protein
MDTNEILHVIGESESWLPMTLVRQAFENHEALAPYFLEALAERVEGKDIQDERIHRLCVFGVFFLAQHRDRRLLELLIGLLEAKELNPEVEGHFFSRLHFYGHRLMAGCCPMDAERLQKIVLDRKRRPVTRSLAICAICA